MIANKYGVDPYDAVQQTIVVAKTVEPKGMIEEIIVGVCITVVGALVITLATRRKNG